MFKLKYKLGDLVTISYEQERIGIIVEIRDCRPFPYAVKWVVGDKTNFARSQSNDTGHYSEGVLIALEERCNIK